MMIIITIILFVVTMACSNNSNIIDNNKINCDTIYNILTN